MTPLKNTVIGSVPYLNARPLVDWFTQTEAGRASSVTVIEAVPSKLFPLLKSGDVAVALLSSVTFFQNKAWGYAPGAGICSNGPVESVRLLSSVPIEQVRRVALDTSSLTSVALLKILLEQRFHIVPEFVPHPPDLDAMLSLADAALLIGDPGFGAYSGDLFTLDLGEEWSLWTGLPFVYALWLGPIGNITPELSGVLQQAKEWGTGHIDAIATYAAAPHGKTIESAIRYLTQAIRYDLGPQEEAGLALFGKKLREMGLIGGRDE